MSDATNSPIPMLAIEPVLTYRASCHCGWADASSSDHDRALVLLMAHTFHTKCSGCAEEIEHDEAQVIDQGRWVGTFCAECAVIYAV